MEFAVGKRDWAQLQIQHEKWRFIAKKLRRGVVSGWKITEEGRVILAKLT